MSEQEITFVDGLFVKKGNFGFKVSICMEDLREFALKHAEKSNSNGKHYLNVEINETKSGDNAYAKLDTWRPDPNYKKNAEPETTEVTSNENSDLPF